MNNVLLGNVSARELITNNTTTLENTGPEDSLNTGSTLSFLPVEGDITFDTPLERREDPGVPPPTEDKNDTGTGNKKNLLLFGIGGLVLAYLLFRKK
jgi:hypothetical protein